MPTCLVVQHVVPESAWSVGTALERAGATLDVRRTFAGDGIPSDTEGLAGLVVMGGPMSAATDEGFPTRRDEVALLADAVARGLPTLGICLGAQLLAVSAGADVSAGAGGPEIGWAPVDFTSAAADDVLLHGLPDRLCVLHWHGDTFTLPAGGELLASNDRYERQAFRVGPVAWGLQFHMEVTAEAVEGFLAAFADEADRAPGGAAAVRDATARGLAELTPWSDLVFERFAALVVRPGGTTTGLSSPHDFACVSDP